MTLPKLHPTPRERFAQLLVNLDLIKSNLPDDTDRIELDLWFSDGVRAKVEIRGLEREG
jgi:hypothetical protein